MRKSSLILGIFLVVVFLSGCGLNNFEQANQSHSGLLLEQAFPEDTWFLASINNFDIQQRQFLENFATKIFQGSGNVKEQFLQAVNTNLEPINLSYSKDIQPVLGDGFRFMVGFNQKTNSDGTVVQLPHAALTLDDEAKAEQLFDTLQKEGRFLKKTVNDYDLYFNVAAAESGEIIFYFLKYQDVLLIANAEDEVIQMANLLRSELAQSLWTNTVYRDQIKKLPLPNTAMVFVNGNFFTSQAKAIENLPSGSLLQELIHYLKGQSLALVATKDGVALYGNAKFDRAKIKADKVDLSEMSLKPIYLYKNMAADGLALYFESYNFATLLNQQLAASADGMFSLKSLLGGEQFDFSKFWGRGYALAVHQDTSFLPALTLLFDVRGDETMAQQFLTNIDQKLAGLIGLFQLQGGALANAFTKEEEILNGVSFKSIQLDLDTIMTAYGKNGLFQLPDQLKGQKIKLFYGITKEHHLLISTYEGWLEEEGVNYLLDDEMYKQSLASIKGFRSGLFYVAFDSLGKILDNWEMMRKAFQSAEVITKEKDAAGIPEKEDLSFSEWVSSLQSAIFSSDLGWYEVKSGGMVLLGK